MLVRNTNLSIICFNVLRRCSRPVPPIRRKCREYESEGLQDQVLCSREAVPSRSQSQGCGVDGQHQRGAGCDLELLPKISGLRGQSKAASDFIRQMEATLETHDAVARRERRYWVTNRLE